MTSTRRDVLAAGVGILAGLAARAAPSWAQANAGLAIVDVAMLGTRDGGEVWFDPVGIRVAPGTILRWTNGDAGNAHTATAYHPANGNHPLRIPADAVPWDSGYLLPGKAFLLTLTVPGVYDYFCRPHEHAGMVGRIVVASLSAMGVTETYGAEGLPDVALRGFPEVERILADGRVAHQRAGQF